MLDQRAVCLGCLGGVLLDEEEQMGGLIWELTVTVGELLEEFWEIGEGQ